MQLTFDLISDLHLDTWNQQLDWEFKATSQILIIAGDVSEDLSQFGSCLEHLSRCYQHIFYIDGNDEHKESWKTSGVNFSRLKRLTAINDSVTYLQNRIAMVQGVAFVGTNGWWTWDFAPEIEPEQSHAWFIERHGCHSAVPKIIKHLAQSDYQYLCDAVARLQKFREVQHIVIVTHTVPCVDLINHDIDLDSTHKMNTMGNSRMLQVLTHDTEHKIKTWCFGHYHGSVDCMISGVRFVNNCRGRGDTSFRQNVYHPLRIEIPA